MRRGVNHPEVTRNNSATGALQRQHSAAAFAPLTGLRANPRERVDPAVAQNEHVTALAGIAIYVLLIAIGITVLQISELLVAHYFVGFLLIPPIALKLWTTGSRFAHYYGGNLSYRLAGSPPLLLRFVVAPIVVASTVAVFATGIELWVFGLALGDGWMTAHTISAVLMVLSGAIHVAAHVRRSAAAVIELARPSRDVASPRIMASTLVLGVAIALASLLYATPFPPSAAGG